MSNNHSKHNTMASHPESSMTSQSSTRIPKRVILAVVAAGILLVLSMFGALPRRDAENRVQ